jgi:FMN phosphatase YigB (HAD superfamily)
MSLRTPIDALVFDLGGVIVPHDNEVLHRRLVSRCAVDDPTERLRAAVHDARYGNGALPVSALHQRLVEEVGYAADWPQFAQDWCCHLGLDEDMLALVEMLAEQRRVMIFSNTNQEHWDHAVAASNGRLGRIEAYLSHEIGDLKPAVSSYLTVAAKAGITPARSLFLDDRQDNVEGARKAGFQAEVFTDQASLEALLRSVELI